MERLKLLLVLTIADIKAVGPGVWTGWKGQLLRTLYYETEVVLGGGDSELARLERVRRRRSAARRAARLDARGLRRLCGPPYARLLAQAVETRRVKHAASCARPRTPGARSPPASRPTRSAA